MAYVFNSGTGGGQVVMWAPQHRPLQTEGRLALTIAKLALAHIRIGSTSVLGYRARSI